MSNKVGRPTYFTPKVRDKILMALRKGAPYEMACNYACVSYSAFRTWILKAEEGNDPEFVQFLEDVKEAEGHTGLIWLDKIDKAMNDGVWQAAAWKLERRHYRHFGNNPLTMADIETLQSYVEQIKASKGVLNNGQKMDTKSDQASRSIEEGAACQAGGENPSQEVN